ncbi:MAG TPA: hypothetical protein GXX49_07555 [Clostridiaceae bacterium]|nr:hypothetical protein [Clostridiaceae bacterium]
MYINLMCSRTSISAWGDLIYGYILFIAAFGWNKVLIFTFFTVFGGLLMGSVFASAHTITFFTGSANAFARIVLNFTTTFATYPEGIYKGALRWIVYSIIPAGFIVFLPRRIFSAFTFKNAALLVAIDIIYILFGYWFFQAGLKRYESGNLIVTKL